jgi:3-hydroxyisobutyrate dehydrogenase
MATSTNLPRVAFLGLGRMGHPMAARLLAAGFPLTVWNRAAARANDLVANGAQRAATPAEAVRDADVVVTMLADPPALQSVLLGENGALDAMRRDSLLVDCSTVGPATARATAEGCRERGIRFTDAPVIGSVPAAEQGTLTILVGGTDEDVERAKVVLVHLGKTIVRTGDVGSASTLKLVMNLLIGGQTELMAETFLLAERAGLSKQVVRETLEGSVLDSPFVRYKAPQLLDRQFSPLFTTRLLLKDIDLALDLARSFQLPLPAVRAARDAYAASASAGRREDDFSAVIATLDDARERPTFPECVTYEVAARVDPGLVDEYESFMRDTHIADVVRTGCFVHGRLERAGAGAFRVSYYATSQDDVDRYLKEHAPRLRGDFEQRFPQGILLTRTVWEDRTRWP